MSIFNACVIFPSRQIIVRKTKDPTFVFLAVLWSALYAWDEALEVLYAHFCWLVSTRSRLHSPTDAITLAHYARVGIQSYIYQRRRPDI